eukprot:UN00751
MDFHETSLRAYEARQRLEDAEDAKSPNSIPNARISQEADGSLRIRIGSIEGFCPSHLFVIPKIHQLQRAWLLAQGETLL